MLDNLDDFIAACVENSGSFAAARSDRPTYFGARDLYCPACGGPRRMAVAVLYRKRMTTEAVGSLNLVDTSTEAIAAQLAPALIVFTCVQCHTTFTGILFMGAGGYELAVFPTVHGGLATPHTPKPVAYYLDQAQRAQSVGANSAAVAMYRAALEQLLYEQGYTARGAGPKIAALQKAIDERTAPRWARDLRPEYLTVIKKLGDAAIHPGEGDVEGQAALDNALLRQLQITFSELLQVVYEREREEQERLEALQRAVSAVEEGPGAAGDNR
jgi:hypothetical protein